VLNEAIHKELQNNSADFDAGFYRSIIPGVVSVCAGLMMIFLLLYFIMANYVNPIYRMSDGIDAYKATGRLFVHKFDGDDQLANVNEGLTDLIEENIELKRRIKALREKE
jgi:sensor histidine kinase YesM